MRREDWEQAVARAVVERAFRTRLLSDPADALTDYGLSESEAAPLEYIRAPSLEQLATRLSQVALGPPLGALLWPER